VKFETLRDFELPVPPFPEQRRILAKLEMLLGKVEGSQRRLAKIPRLLKRFRQCSIRPIINKSALMFTRSFFPTLFLIGDIETAMWQARTLLAERETDWSAYVLFSRVKRIEDLQFRSEDRNFVIGDRTLSA
jgi:hypothetical protein